MRAHGALIQEGGHMSAWRRLLGLAGLLTLILVLAGCMHVDRTLHVNMDGSGVYTLTLGFREPNPVDPSGVPQNVITPMEGFGAYVKETGGSYRRYEDQGYAYWTFTRPFASVVEMDTLLQEDPRQYDANRFPVLYRDSLHIARESRFLSPVFHVTGTISLVDILNTAQNWRDSTETLGITMAGGIVSHTGGVREGNTVTYTIHYNESARIDVVGGTAGTSEALSGHSSLLLAGVLALLAVALVVGGVLVLRSAAKK